MRIVVFILLTLAAMSRAVQAADADAAGCSDLGQLPRLEGCIIQECSAKQHDSFDTGADTSDSSAGPLDANVNSLAYSCPASKSLSAAMDLQRVKRALDAEIRKAGYLNVAEDKTDPANPVVTARKGSHWLRWGASSEDGATLYSVTSAESATETFKTEACAQPQVLSLPKSCQIVECTSKSEDSVGMRTAQKEQTSIAGVVQTATLSCPANPPGQTLLAAEEELKRSGFEILFSDREHQDSGWVTGRAGKRWVELVSAPDGESISYALTVVPSAEVLTAVKSDPSSVAVTPIPATTPIPASETKPVAEPKPVEVAAQIPKSFPKESPLPSEPPLPIESQVPISKPVPALSRAGFVPPVPILQVPIEPTHDRIYSVMGDVVINIQVDVDEDGSVTKAVLTGRITKDVLKLESAALDAVSHWRFEPARQDGRIVPAVKITVQMHFHGRPWRF
jgi:periplasmic protein TonB